MKIFLAVALVVFVVGGLLGHLDCKRREREIREHLKREAERE